MVDRRNNRPQADDDEGGTNAPARMTQQEAEQERVAQQRDANDVDRQARRDAMQDKAVDENDPRVVPHLDTANSQANLDEGERQRREKALSDSRATIEEDNAKIAAARENLQQAQDALSSAVEAYGQHLTTLSQVEASVPPQIPAQHLSPNEDTKPMFFPKPVVINHNGRTVNFSAGIHLVPESAMDHWWLDANGVRPYTGTLPDPVQSEDADANDDDDTSRRSVGRQRTEDRTQV